MLDVHAIAAQPSGAILFEIGGVLYERAEALRVLNPRPAYQGDGPASRLLDSAARYAVPALVSMDRSSWTPVPDAAEETIEQVNAKLLAIIARCKTGYA